VLQSFLILPQRGDPLVATGWTLVYELYFYFVFGLALLLPRRRLGWVMAAWLAITALIHFAFTPTSNAWLGCWATWWWSSSCSASRSAGS